MDKDFLKKLGLTDEIADKVMDQHDKDVQQLKDNNAELQSTNDSLNEQITSNAKQLKDLKKVAGDNEELQAKLDKAMSDSQEREKKLKDQIATQRKNFAVGNALRDAGAKNSKAVEALLDLDKVSLDDNGQLIGISDQIDRIKKSDSYSIPNLNPMLSLVPKEILATLITRVKNRLLILFKRIWKKESR